MKLADIFRPRMSIIAAAQQIRLDDRKAQEAHKRRQQTWQDLAWRYYDEVPEIWFATNYVANALRRVRLFPAEQPDPQQPPVPLEMTDPVGARARLELDRLRSIDGSHGEIVHDLAMQLTIPGEGWLVGDVDPESGDEFWGIYSRSELGVDSSGKWVIYEDPDDKTGRTLTDLAMEPYRIFRQHPRWRNRADSSMRAVIELLDELQILARDVRATGRQRLNNGILLAPNEVKVKGTDGQGQSAAMPGNAPKVHPFVKAVTDLVVTAIQDEGTAAAAAPGVMFVPGDTIAKFRHLTFSREYSDIAMRQREELRVRIASGLDLPSEVILGKADLNHWTAWQVSEETFDAHLAPLVQLICSGLTEAFLRPALDEQDRQVIVWYDASDLISNPNRGNDADGAWDRFTISDDAYRRYKGYTKADAITDDKELERRLLIRQLGAPSALTALQTTGQTVGDVLEGADAPTSSADAASSAADEAPTEAAPPAEAPPAPAAAVIAAADGESPRVRELQRAGEHLRAIDTELRLRLQAAADGIVRDVLQDLSAHGVTAAAAVDAADKVDGLRSRYDAWVAQAQYQTRKTARKLALQPVDETEEEPLIHQETESREAGWLALSASLLGLILTEQRGAEATPAPDGTINLATAGEVDTSVTVPAGLVREALAVAGGAQGVEAAGGALVDPVTGSPLGGVSTGVNALEVFRRVGILNRGWTWVYGDAARTNSFIAHEELNDVEFDSWEADVLAVREEDAWLDVTHYFPGDHYGCQCDFAPAFADVLTEEAA